MPGKTEECIKICPKNEWSYTFTPPVCLHGMVLSKKKKARDNFTFTFTNAALPIIE
jgi:hypothetical protein